MIAKHASSTEQRREVAGGNNARFFVTVEDQEVGLVARHEVIGFAAFGQRQQKIVIRIGRSFYARQGRDILGELLDLVDQSPGLVWSDKFGQARLLQRGAQFVTLRGACQERKFSVQPSVNDRGRFTSRGDQRGHDDIGIENNARQAFSAFFLVRRSERTSLTASSTMR